MISNLLRKTKEIQIDKIKFTLKKFPALFAGYLYSKSREGFKYETDDKGNITKILEIGKFPSEALALKIVNGLESWGLVDKDGFVIPINETSALEIINYHPDFAENLLREIENFNFSLDEDDKKK